MKNKTNKYLTNNTTTNIKVSITNTEKDKISIDKTCMKLSSNYKKLGSD